MNKTNPTNQQTTMLALIALVVVAVVVLALVMGRPTIINANDGSSVSFSQSVEIEVLPPKSAGHDPPADRRPH